ncbi:MAG: glycosyltransferase family 39 protein, partial [Verrucomicrobiae bacterium]|nr:glycosyltransferase family 39 protein [Verrucomicrobiae bacterium]
MLLALLIVALWQRWPAMGHSLWGDEDWAFSDYVHGHWKPKKGSNWQGPLKFSQVSWTQTIFGDQQGNNHWLSSILQRQSLRLWRELEGHRPWEFDETVMRLVPLLAGLGGLVVLALFLRSLGRPLEGLVAAFFMEFHPLHVRFSTEARGYSLMLLMMVLALWMAWRCVKTGRLSDWLAFGLAQWLVMIAWKGALYPLAFLNVLMLAVLLNRARGGGVEHRRQLSRWVAANLIGAMLFLPFGVTSQLQVRRSIDQVRHRARPMGWVWAANTISETLMGMPWKEEDPTNPREVSLERQIRNSPMSVLLPIGIGSMLSL